MGDHDGCWLDNMGQGGPTPKVNLAQIDEGIKVERDCKLARIWWLAWDPLAFRGEGGV